MTLQQPYDKQYTPKNLSEKFWIRLIIYSIIGFGYISFMSNYAPLGVDWRPFHQERVINAVDHILNGSPLLKYGLTSWDQLDKINNSLATNGYISAYINNWYVDLCKIRP